MSYETSKKFFLLYQYVISDIHIHVYVYIYIHFFFFFLLTALFLYSSNFINNKCFMKKNFFLNLYRINFIKDLECPIDIKLSLSNTYDKINLFYSFL